ncbi:MAG: gfo/Idh/MocA family oxidoreductase [Candidatus Hydrogenedens sp.]|nr:gfo/Idh/MocA family oxidoreductase [Candidatus Hydrogenedens sp.]
MTTIRAGVIGAGHLGYHHARNYAALEGVELAGVADSDPGRRAKAEADFGAPAYATAAELLASGIDAVSVVTPTTSHHAVVMECLEAGVPVLVEKPIAPALAEAEAMVAAAKAKGLLLQVGHIERFNGAVMALAESLRNPRFIECHRLSPFPGRGTDVSVVLDLMIHDLDIVFALTQSEVVSIDAVGVPVFSESEDIANVRLRFASGCVANLTSSRVSLEKMRKIRIFEDNAYVSTDYSAQEVVVYRKKPGAIPEGANPMEHIEIQPLDVKKDEPLKLELASFIECVRTGTRPVVSGEDGVRALRLARDILAFIEEHGPKPAGDAGA